VFKVNAGYPVIAAFNDRVYIKIFNIGILLIFLTKYNLILTASAWRVKLSQKKVLGYHTYK